MHTVNKVILLGTLGQNPEIKYLTSGIAVCEFSLATNYQKKNETGTYESITEWHQIAIYGKYATHTHQYLQKGAKVYLEGRIQYNTYIDPTSGKNVTRTKIIAHSIIFLPSGKMEDIYPPKAQDVVDSDLPPNLDDLPF